MNNFLPYSYSILRARSLVNQRLALCLSMSLLVMLPTLARSTTHTAAPPAIKGSSIRYTIQAGDTLASVCKKFNVTAASGCQQLALFNTIENGKLPATGSTLYIPLDALPSRPEKVRLIQTTGSVKTNQKIASAGERLDENTKIEAGENSSAVLELADGSQVQILPNSVADIVRSRSYSTPNNSTSSKVVNWIGSKIRLVQGMLQTNANKAQSQQPGTSVEVETTTSLLGVRGTRFRVAAADKTVPFDRAEVSQGAVSNINTWKNSEIELHAGQGAVVDPNLAEMQAVGLLAPPVVPAKGQLLRRPDAYWRFTPVEGASAYRVIAAKDPAFQIISYSEKSVSPEADLNSLPSNGTWYMLARAIDHFGLEGLDAYSSIKLQQPDWLWVNPSIRRDNGRNYLIWTDISDANFKPLAGTSTLKLEFFRNKDLSDPIATISNANTKDLMLPALAYGTYYLRVTLDNSSLKNDEHKLFTFELDSNAHHQAYTRLLSQLH